MDGKQAKLRRGKLMLELPNSIAAGFVRTLLKQSGEQHDSVLFYLPGLNKLVWHWAVQEMFSLCRSDKEAEMNDGGMLLVGCVFCELLVGAGYALYDGGQQAVVKACRNNEIYQTQSLVMACKIIKETK